MKKIVASLLWTLLLASCQNTSTSETIVLKVWEDANNHEMVQLLLDEFIANYRTMYPSAPLMEIELIEESEGATTDDLSREGPAGNGPDVFAFVHDTLASAVNNDLIAEVTDVDFLNAHHQEAAVKAFTYEDIVFGYPITSESQVLMYDGDQLTADDVLSFENLKTSGERIVMDVKNSDSNAYYTFALLTDADLFGADGIDKTSLNLATPASINNLTSFAHDYQDVIINGTPDTALTIIDIGDAAGVISSPYLWDTFKSQISNAKMAVIPSINATPLRPFSGYKGYGVSRYSTSPALAHDLAKFLVSSIAQEVRFNQKTLMPTIVDNERLNLTLADSIEAGVFSDSLNNSLTMPNIIAMGSYWATMNDAMTEIWNLGDQATTTTVKEILTNATNAIKSKIA